MKSNPNKKFRTVDGNYYTVADLNSLDELPSGMVFDELDLKGQAISKLPRNLVVSGDLWLSNTALIKEIPTGTVVGGRLLLHDCQVETLPKGLSCLGLHLKNSKVTHIPDNSSIKELHLEGSIVTSIGKNVSINNCHDDQGRNFTSTVTCKNYVLSSVQEHARVRNIKAERATLRLASTNKSSLASITVEDVEITRLTYGPQAAKLILNVLKNVKCKSLENNNPFDASIQYSFLNIDGAEIENVLLMDHSKAITEVLNLKLQGNFHFGYNKARGSNFKLPEYGLVFGNVLVPEGAEVPPTFCCMGNITVMTPELAW